MSYKIKIENFEYPLDILIFFIQKDQLNIYDIPIAHIAHKLPCCMKTMDMINIEIGGEFVYMTSHRMGEYLDLFTKDHAVK